jgi:DNA gyrase subunit B
LTAVLILRSEIRSLKDKTKTKLGNSELRGIVDNMLSEGLTEFFDENPVEAKK